MKHYFSSFSKALLVPLAITAWVGCSDDNVPGEDQRPGSNSVPGSEVGIRELKVALPRMTRMAPITEDMNCRVHLRGKGDRVNYVLSTFLTLTDDTVFLESHDPILSELPHQMYHLNGVSFPNPKLTSRSGEAAEDTIYVGARLSIEDPDDIHLGSTVTVGSNHVGTGTADDPYMIACGTDFIDRICNSMVHGDTHEGEYFELSGNINLNTYDVTNGKGWEPAGHFGDQSAVPFQGDLNGNDCAIDALLCFSDAGAGGLFYWLGEKSRIHNIEFNNVNLNGGEEVGAVASKASKGCRLDSLSVNGYIEGVKNVGGFVGHGEASFTACISEVSVSGADSGSALGGFIGTSADVSFTDCIRTGKIDAPSTHGVGGYVGKFSYDVSDDDTCYAMFQRCYTAGSIEGKDDVGGFAGSMPSSFTDCYAAATLPLDSRIYPRKWDIFGANEAMVPYALEVKGYEEAGGFVGTSLVMLKGDNGFVYKSSSKPSILVDKDDAGAILGAGSCVGQNATFTSYAYVKGGDLFVGGLFGDLYRARLSRCVFTNYGNVEGGKYVGGITGNVNLSDFDGSVLENTGNVYGKSHVGGIIGSAYDIKNGCLKNFGSVKASEDTAGGYVGYCYSLDLADGSCISSSDGSVTVEGRSEVGGIIGSLYSSDSSDAIGYYGSVYANVISSQGSVGGLIGCAVVYPNKKETITLFNSESMRDSNAHVSVTANSGNYAAGGIGYLRMYGSSRDSRKCVVNGIDDSLQGSVTSIGDAVGGIIGFAESVDVDLEISDCHNFVNVRGNSSGWGKGYGGILGMQSDTFDYLDFRNCSNHGDISGVMLTDVAGIVGYSVHNLKVLQCYNAGRIEGTSGVGGLVGYLNNNGEIMDSFNMGEVAGTQDCKFRAGIIGQKEDKSDRTLTLECVYNVGQTGWGIVGGESGADLDMHNVYYLNTASSGDMDDSGSHSMTADQMRGQLGGFTGDTWFFHEGEYAPTLRYTNMYNLKPLSK